MALKWLTVSLFLIFANWTTSVARAQNVTITPLGAAANEFCVGDRALLFEDPTGVRVLIAPGRTVGLDTGAFVIQTVQEAQPDHLNFPLKEMHQRLRPDLIQRCLLAVRCQISSLRRLKTLTGERRRQGVRRMVWTTNLLS